VQVECQDKGEFYPAIVREADGTHRVQRVLVHFKGWHARFDHWLPVDSPRLKPCPAPLAPRARLAQSDPRAGDQGCGFQRSGTGSRGEALGLGGSTRGHLGNLPPAQAEVLPARGRADGVERLRGRRFEGVAQRCVRSSHGSSVAVLGRLVWREGVKALTESEKEFRVRDVVE